MVEWLPHTSPSAAPTFVIDKPKPISGRTEEFAEWLWSLGPEELNRWALREKLPSLPPSVKLKQRGIYDLRSINRARTLSLPMSFTGVATVAQAIGADSFMAAVDYSEGYTSAPVAQTAGDILQSDTPHGVITHRSLPFGYWAAPFIFSFLSGEAARQAHALFLRPHEYTSVYIDDTIMVLDGPRQRAEAVFDAVVNHVRHLGFTVNDTKVQRPGKSVEYLGVKLTCDDGVTATIPHSKAVGLQLLLKLALDKADWPRRFWRRLLGKLQAAAFMIPGSRPVLSQAREIQRGTAWRLSGEMRAISAPQETLEALAWFAVELDASEGSRLRMAPRTVRGRGVAFTDASGSGGLGAVLAVAGTGRQQRRPHIASMSVWADTPGNEHSTSLELQAVYEAMLRMTRTWQHDGAGLSDLCNLWVATVCTDSQAAVHAWAKGYSNRNPKVNDQIRRIAGLCRSFQVSLDMRWVPREANRLADALSHPGSAEQRRASDVVSNLVSGSLQELASWSQAFGQ